MIRKIALTLAVLPLMPLLSSCDDDSSYAAAVCSGPGDFRAEDFYCSQPHPGYSWAYIGYHAYDDGIDIVYVGYPLDRRIYLANPPRGVPRSHIERGGFPSSAPVGGSSVAHVSTLAQNTGAKGAPKPSGRTIVRGGLGVPASRATGAPTPVRGLDSAAPGRTAPAKPVPAKLGGTVSPKPASPPAKAPNPPVSGYKSK